jgi:hypothetical protein
MIPGADSGSPTDDVEKRLSPVPDLSDGSLKRRGKVLGVLNALAIAADAFDHLLELRRGPCEDKVIGEIGEREARR